MSGVGAVIGTLRAVGGTVITDATQAVISGAATTGVTRFVELSSFAVLRERLSAPAKLMSSTAMSAMAKDKAAAEDALRASDLDYTLVQAVRLTNGPATGVTKLLPESATLRMGGHHQPCRRRRLDAHRAHRHDHQPPLCRHRRLTRPISHASSPPEPGESP